MSSISNDQQKYDNASINKKHLLIPNLNLKNTENYNSVSISNEK
jgi:hypothetical protein